MPFLNVPKNSVLPLPADSSQIPGLIEEDWADGKRVHSKCLGAARIP